VRAYPRTTILSASGDFYTLEKGENIFCTGLAFLREAVASIGQLVRIHRRLDMDQMPFLRRDRHDVDSPIVTTLFPFADGIIQTDEIFSAGIGSIHSAAPGESFLHGLVLFDQSASSGV
jgi:hypothetical protein